MHFNYKTVNLFTAQTHNCLQMLSFIKCFICTLFNTYDIKRTFILFGKEGRRKRTVKNQWHICYANIYRRFFSYMYVPITQICAWNGKIQEQVSSSTELCLLTSSHLHCEYRRKNLIYCLSDSFLKLNTFHRLSRQSVHELEINLSNRSMWNSACGFNWSMGYRLL